MANRIIKKWIGSDAIDSERLLLDNNSPVRSKDSAGTGEVELIKANSSDKVVIKNLTTPVDADDAASKTYVDTAISGVSGDYVDVSGDTMTGDLTIQNGATAADNAVYSHDSITASNGFDIVAASTVLIQANSGNSNVAFTASELHIGMSPLKGSLSTEGSLQFDSVNGTVDIQGGSGDVNIDSAAKIKLNSVEIENGTDIKANKLSGIGIASGSLTFSGSGNADVTLSAANDMDLQASGDLSLSAAVSGSLTVNGGNSEFDFFSPIDMNSKKISNLLDPSSAQDAATKKYVDDENDLQLDLAGGTMSGNITMSGGSTVTGVPTPTNASDAAPKSYVDTVAEGLHVHAPARLLANVDLDGSYNNGTSGVGAYLDFSASPIAGIDGVSSFSVGNRIIVAKQNNNSLDPENGIYYIKEAADIDGNGDIIKLTRAIDFDTPAEMAGGDFIFVQEGTQYADSGWVMSETVVTVGTTPVQFLQFSGAGSFTADGEGIELVGSQFELELDGSTLSKSANGLKVASGGITNTEVSASAAIDYSKLAALTADRALQSNGSGVVSVSSVTSTELGYLSGSDSNIQDQIDAIEAYAPKRFKRVLDSTDVSNGYIDITVASSASTAKDFHIFADRLALHQDASWTTGTTSPDGDDFVIQNPNATTIRVLFLNDLVGSGNQKLQIGDTVYCRYTHNV
jgi:hypothetical protein